jgi:hypothetical protein
MPGKAKSKPATLNPPETFLQGQAAVLKRDVTDAGTVYPAGTRGIIQRTLTDVVNPETGEKRFAYHLMIELSETETVLAAEDPATGEQFYETRQKRTLIRVPVRDAELDYS